MDYGNQVAFAFPRLTPGVKLLLLINAGVFVANMLVVPLFGTTLGEWLGVSWTRLWDGYGLGLLRLVTYQFVHSFTLFGHILFNMLMLYFFGTFVEERIGKQRIIQLYLLSGIFGALLQILLESVLTGPSAAYTIGASGACYGILIYAACMAPTLRVILIVFPIELRWVAIGLVVFGLYSTYVQVVVGGGDGVAHGGHLGGALWGYLAYRTPARDLDLAAKWRSWQADREVRNAHEDRQRLDELLEKVHRDGIGSLTPQERRFLDRASKQMRRKD